MKITIRDTIQPTIKAGIIFFMALVAGYICASILPDAANQIMDDVRESTQGTLNPNLSYEAFNIFSHNTYVSVIMIFIGAVFGYILKFREGSYLLLILNGAMIGVISYVAILQFGIIGLLLLTMIHGIIELPTVFFSAGLGVAISTRLAKREFDKAAFISSVKLFVFVVIPLYAISASIEAFVTGGIIVPILKQLISIS